MSAYIITISFVFFVCCQIAQLQANSAIKYMYVPTHSLRKMDICSIMSIALAPISDAYWKKRVDAHHSRRTMLNFLLSIKATAHNKHLLDWIEECHPHFDWTLAEKNYQYLRTTIETYQTSYNAQNLGNYWQLKVPLASPLPNQAREYISYYRSHGFQPHELKLYWNYNELKDLNIAQHYNSMTDKDSHYALLNSPVHSRKHSGSIRFVQAGIQDAVFQVPYGKQVIVLDFADERMPGGYFLEGFMTQEEVSVFIIRSHLLRFDL